MSLLTVIIPVYRVEATLDKCVESVVGQQYADLEVILVDDGSPDGSPQRCDEWVARDSRIRVIHQANGGLSAARNKGIETAHGDYITFVDSDDFIAPGTYRPLMELMAQHPEYDILEYPTAVFYGSPREHSLDFPDETVYHDMAQYWYEGEGYQHTYACNKIYKRGLFDDIRYPIGMIFEDVRTMPLLLEKTKVLATTCMGRYFYCHNPKGITATADGPGLRMLLQPHVEIIRQSQRRDRAFQTYYLHVLNIQMDVFERTGDEPILPQLPVGPSQVEGLLKLKALALNLLGINRLCCINKIIHKIWRNH